MRTAQTVGMLESAAFMVLQILSAWPCQALMNEHQETANSVIFLRPQAELDAEPWLSGVQCLEAYMKITFISRARLTRAYNVLITNSYNISSPGLEIQDGITKLLNEVIRQSNERGRRFYQLRAVYDNNKYVKVKISDSAVIPTDYYIIIVDSVDLLRQLMRDYISRMNSWNPGARFLLLYNNSTRRDSEHAVAMELFTLLQKQYYVHQIALLYATTDLNYSFSVMDYYNHENCRTIRVSKIGECTNGVPQPSTAEVKRRLRKFEREIEIKNCTFLMCAAIAAPFVEKNCHTGIELRIITFMRNRLKFKIKQSCKRDNRGVREENGTWTGLLGKLIDRNCDFILGGFYPDNEVNEDFWASTCYLSDSYTWYVKLADRRPAWIALYQIFQDETWMCFLALFLLTSLFWYFFVNILPEPLDHKDLSLAGINAMAVSICVAVEERPECYASRIFFLALTFYGMNVVAVYTSRLISVFTDPGFMHQIDTLKEVIEADIPFGGPDENQDWFENDEDMWIFEKYNDSSLFIPNSVNLRAVKHGKRVLLASRMYVLQDRLSDQIFAFPQNVFSTPLQIITKAGFPLIPDFNWLIGAMRDHGIFQKIEQDFQYNNTYLNRISRMRPDFKKSTIVLTTDHLKGPFAILIIGIVGGIILFISELIYYRIAKTCLNKNSTTKQSKKASKLKRSKRTKKSSKIKTRPTSTWWPLKKRFSKTRKNSANRQQGMIKSTNIRQVGEQTYEVNAVRDIRFTPIKRRYVDLRVFY